MSATCKLRSGQRCRLRNDVGRCAARGDAHAGGIFGVADRVGSLQPGREGNVVVWSGDPFEFTTRVEHVFVRGREYHDKSRQDHADGALQDSAGARITIRRSRRRRYRRKRLP